MTNRILLFVCILFVLSGVQNLSAQNTDLLPEDFPFTLLFISTDERAYGDIYALHPDSGEAAVLVTNASAQYPIWSEVNEELAFVSGQPGGDDIYVLNIEEQIVVNVTQNEAHEMYPRWSPDGEKIAFSTDVTGDWELFSVDRDDYELRNLSNHSDATDGRWGLDWSPDGKQIVFVSNRSGRDGIYVMDADGSNQRLLLPNAPPSEDRYPVWSPATDQIAFLSHRADGYGIYLINEDGSGLTFLRPNSAFPPTARYHHLSWSPDGSYLAFELATEGLNSQELYVVELLDGSNLIRLTTNNLYDIYPGWASRSVLESDLFPIFLPDLLQNPSENSYSVE